MSWSMHVAQQNSGPLVQGAGWPGPGELPAFLLSVPNEPRWCLLNTSEQTGVTCETLFPMQLEFHPFFILSKGIESPNLELRTQNRMEKMQALLFCCCCLCCLSLVFCLGVSGDDAERGVGGRGPVRGRVEGPGCRAHGRSAEGPPAPVLSVWESGFC